MPDNNLPNQYIDFQEKYFLFIHIKIVSSSSGSCIKAKENLTPVADFTIHSFNQYKFYCICNGILILL